MFFPKLIRMDIEDAEEMESRDKEREGRKRLVGREGKREAGERALCPCYFCSTKAPTSSGASVTSSR